jgi:Putative restriction endonuclease
VEVVSPGSARRDRGIKPPMYAEAGIKWYMRIEQKGANAPLVFLYRLEGNAYAEHARAHAGQTFHMTEPIKVSFDPAMLTQIAP